MPEINEIIEEVQELKVDIDNAKQEKSKYEGVLSEHMKSLKKLEVSSVKDGNKKLESSKKELVKLEDKIKKLFSELQEKYEW